MESLDGKLRNTANRQTPSFYHQQAERGIVESKESVEVAFPNEEIAQNLAQWAVHLDSLDSEDGESNIEAFEGNGEQGDAQSASTKVSDLKQRMHTLDCRLQSSIASGISRLKDCESELNFR